MTGNSPFKEIIVYYHILFGKFTIVLYMRQLFRIPSSRPFPLSDQGNEKKGIERKFLWNMLKNMV